ncbi:MAG: outer membrane protein assembly factor BamD [Deltaproteobacteria bacterium]|nr:outer membrane protein assembly factor BamD [Deltaproteobacteria bacterium]
MTEINAGTNTITCTEATAFWDSEVNEMLSAAQRLAVVQHIEECPACSEFTALTEGLFKLPEQLLTDDELDNAISNVMGNARAYRREQRSRKRLWFGVAAIAAVAVFSVLISLFFTESVSPATAPCTPTTPEALAPGVFMSYCTPDKPVTMVEKDGDVNVTMREGTVGLSIDPNRKKKQSVIVVTPQGNVAVKGTIFTVHVNEGITTVDVFRGIVQIEPASADSNPFTATAGHTALLPSGKVQTLEKPNAEALKQTLFQVTYEPVASAESVANADGNQSPQKTSAAANSAAVQNNDAALSAPQPTTPENPASASSARQRQSQGAAAPSMQSYIEEAQACMIDQDWKCAAKKYRSALSRFPQRPESSTVLIGLAKIELRHLHAPQKALTHYQQYLQKTPNGPLAEEAHQGIIASYRNLGRTADEQNSLRGFVAKYPGSSYTPKAKTRLDQLQSTAN